MFDIHCFISWIMSNRPSTSWLQEGWSVRPDFTLRRESRHQRFTTTTTYTTFIFPQNITILSFLSMITSWVNVEHARLILPPHLVTSLAINRSKVFIGLDTMIQSRSVLRNHLFLRIFHSAWKPPLKCDLLGKGIHVTNNGDIAANDARNFSGWAISHMGVYMIIVKLYTQIFGVLWKWSHGIPQAPTEISKEVEVIT